MGESAYALYTPYKPVEGGRARVRTARGRDRFGRLLPNDPTKALPVPDCHGKAGGRARASKAKRDCKGRFIKAEKEKSR